LFKEERVFTNRQRRDEKSEHANTTPRNTHYNRAGPTKQKAANKQRINEHQNSKQKYLEHRSKAQQANKVPSRNEVARELRGRNPEQRTITHWNGYAELRSHRKDRKCIHKLSQTARQCTMRKTKDAHTGKNTAQRLKVFKMSLMRRAERT